MENLSDFKPESTTVWSFPDRGNWATHSSKYRGNFAPQIARNIILKYSKENDIVLDPMVGSGTTLIECKILNRNGIGVDINSEAAKLTAKNLQFKNNNNSFQIAILGNVKDLKFIKDDSINLILTHPPYLNIIKYSNGRIKEDLSNISSVKKFCDEFNFAIKEFYRVLKEDHYCAILIGDTRKYQHYVPLSYYILKRFFENGFVLKEDIIKIQHNCESTPYWKKYVKKYNFYLIMHEHLFVFRKPKKDENLNKIKYSMGML